MSKEWPDGAETQLAQDADAEDHTIASQGDGGSDGLGLLELEPGSYAGRYLVLSELGRGGMGVVYMAYDPDMDRRIALKLLSVGTDRETLGNRSRERLLREAQALAQLSHPNVVAAYDVGTIDKSVFVAMELVEGQDLKTWQKETKPDRRHLVEALVAAGQGIAAAHQAGLIHRDIKPGNLIVGQDGRVRVLDFGLARATVQPEPMNGVRESDFDLVSEGTKLRSSLTLDGAVVGTPGYMAPEQYLGGEVDEYTDQYSFCVTLFEALYGVRPVRARKLKDLREKVTAGQIESPPAQAKVPARLGRIALRGLSVAKEDRYPSMTALLADLSLDPRVRRRRIWLSVLMVLLVALSFAGASAFQAHRQRLCQGAEARLAGVWDDQVQKLIQKGFAASPRAHAPDTFRRLVKRLDRHADDWLAMRSEACQATRVRGEQSGQLMDLRMRCLDRRLGEMQALTQMFARRADEEVVDRALEAVFKLTKIEVCADTEALTAAVALPEDAQIRKQLTQLRRQLDETATLKKMGKYQEASAGIGAMVETASKLDYPPVLADALYLQANLEMANGKYERAKDLYYQAMRAAAYAQNEMRVADSWSGVVVALTKLGKYDQALVCRAAALVAVAATGDNPLVYARVLSVLAEVHDKQARPQQALKLQQQALALRESVLPADHPEVAQSLNSLGTVYLNLEELEQAHQHYLRALSIMEKAYGPNHPKVVPPLSNLGLVFKRQGKARQALAVWRRSLRIEEQVLGSAHPDLAISLYNLGNILRGLERYDEAQVAFARALAIREQALGLEHPLLANPLLGLANLAFSRQQYEKALTYYRRSLAIAEKTMGPDHPQTAFALFNLGNVFNSQKKFAPALQYMKRAHKILAKALGRKNVWAAHVQQAIGKYYLKRGRLKEAQTTLREVLAIRQTITVSPVDLAETRISLAETLVAQGKIDAQTRHLAELARDAFAVAGKEDKKNEIEIWMRKSWP